MVGRALIRLSDGLDRIATWAGYAAIVLMVVLVGIQVVARYLFAQPPGWTEEGARYAMVWGGLLGAAVAFRGGLDPIVAKAALFDRHPAWRIAGGLLRGISVFAFVVPIWWYSFFGLNVNPERGFLARSAGRLAEGLEVSMVWFTVAVPVMATLILIHLAASMFRPPAPPREYDT